MRSIKQAIQATLLVCGSLLVALGYPLSVLADEVPTAVTDPSTTSVPVESGTTETPPPTGETNAAPVAIETAAPTTETVPTPEPPKPTYTYDASTGRWNSNNWTYDSISGTYKQTVQPVVAPITVSPENAGNANGLAIDSSTTNAIANALSANALTGDASVLRNTLAGNATTGDATSATTIINNVNSSLASNANQQASQFVTNIMGDVNGDIMLQPMLLKAMLESAMQQPTSTSIHANTNTAINNNLTLGAQSGNANVAGNTTAGNATSGSANTVANVVNLVNSMIAANQSFVGTVNIYGNLNGDILIAPDFIPKLLASNGDTSESAKAVGTASITSNNNASIINNIALAAKTGEALVSGNTTAGDANSGSATTNAVIFNLTNHEVVASNSLLVFVNVLGRWVGVIIDAPTGATAAAIGDGVTKNTVAPNLVIDATNTTAITNNLDLNSTSGNALVTHNTFAGNALSGNATASANVANIVGNNIGLSGWFGVLFINVFGSWVGSFGLNTSAGDPIIDTSSATSQAGKEVQPLRVIEFVPRGIRQSPAATVIQQGAIVPPANDAENTATDESDTLSQPLAVSGPSGAVLQGGASLIDKFNLPMLFGSLVLVGGSLVSLKRVA